MTKKLVIMKTKLLLMSLAMLGLALQACNDDDDHHRNPAAERTFKTMYPGATSVRWEGIRGYSVADFRYEGYERDAWYNREGVWFMTETDIPFNDLPAGVKTSFGASEYAQWTVDDVDMVERKDIETVYILEVEQGNQEYDLYYTEDGTLIKAVPDGDNDYLPPTLNATVMAFLETNYPNAKIVEADYENNKLEVDIIDGTKLREVVFNSASAWLYTKTEVQQADVPQAVMTALQDSQYAAYTIEEIDQYIPNGSNEYYIFELKNGNTEVDIRINLDGSIQVLGS